MKILVVTDCHGRFEKLLKVFEDENPDIILCAGDNSTDVEELSYLREDKKYYIVRGNCDFYDMKHRDIEIFDILGKKFLLAHGHHYGVKSTYDLIKREGIEKKIDIVVFGHTHIPYLEEGEVTLYNPGALKDGYYGVIDLEENSIKIETKKI